MKISAINNLNDKYRYKTNFSAQNKQKHDEAIKKRNYIEAKTKTLDDFCTGTLLIALLAGSFDVDILDKNKKHLATGFALISGVAFIINCIRKIKLSKEYDKTKD